MSGGGEKSFGGASGRDELGIKRERILLRIGETLLYSILSLEGKEQHGLTLGRGVGRGCSVNTRILVVRREKLTTRARTTEDSVSQVNPLPTGKRAFKRGGRRRYLTGKRLGE